MTPPTAQADKPAEAKNSTATDDQAKKPGSRTRSTYEPWQREMVRREYPTCTTPEEKKDLCRRAGIKDIRRLYNLACQEKITRRSDDLSDAEFRAFTNGDKSIMSLRRSYTPEDEQELLTRRDDPRATQFSKEDDKYLIEHFGRMNIVAIAKQRGFSEAAVMYRARQLTRQEKGPDGKRLPAQPLRKPAVGFSLKRVSAWLGLSEDEVHELVAVGVIIRPLPSKQGDVHGHWVLAKTLAPFLKNHGARLVKERNADMFFIKEILETEQQLADGKTERTGCYFVDHGHKCANPWAGPRHDSYCPHGIDAKCKVKELRF